MITTRTIPLSTATAQELLVEITENVCRPYCVNGSNLPTASVAYEVGTVQVIDGNVVAPIVARVTVMSPTGDCGCAKTQVFTERFSVAFNASGTNTVSVAQGTGTIIDPAYVRCCKARGVKITGTIVVSIA